jgi:DNA-directed RNA polymerase specialized sigma24 family protein
MGHHDPVLADGNSERLAQVIEGLERLAAVDPKLAELVGLHFFCGFSLVEIAETRQVSDRTIQRDWRKARILLEGLL